MADPFVPPSLSSHQGPADDFTPPQVSSDQGMATDFTPPAATSDKNRDNAADAWAATQGLVSGVLNAFKGIPSGIYQTVTNPRGTFNTMRDDMRALREQGDAELNRGNYADAAGHYLGGMVPMIGPVLARGMDAVFSGDPNQAGQALGGLLSLEAAPKAMDVAGKATRAIAAPLAEAALGIRNINRVTSPQPGAAALEYTSGFRPATVSASARDVISDAVAKRDALLAASPNTVSMFPGQDAIANAIQRAQAGNSEVPHLRPIEQQLTTARPGVQAATVTLPTGERVLAPNQAPLDYLGLRQRVGQDFTKFDIARPSPDEAIRAGNTTYKAMTDELHRAVPEAAPYDRQIADLIPVKDEGRAKSYNAGITQSTLNRIARPTGALIGAAAGGAAAGPFGAAAGLLAPEIMSNPAVQMAGARALYRGGGFLRATPVQQAAQAALLQQLSRRGGLLQNNEDYLK